MPAAKGLFHRAVIQGAYGLRMVESSAAAETTERILADLGLKKISLSGFISFIPSSCGMLITIFVNGIPSHLLKKDEML